MSAKEKTPKGARITNPQAPSDTSPVRVGNPRSDLHLSFDVGHSSLGWAVLQTSDSDPLQIKGCGVVTFRADDCLASTRRGYRRQRRHIRSTRQRIARMKILLAHLGVLKMEQLDQPGCAWPWQLAARVLCGGKLLSWPELWDVLRWYAHNRGYDGNRRWSAAEAAAADEDTEKEENAKNLMGKHGVSSMAETFCKELGVDPLGEKKSSMVRFKGLNAAFPRQVVEGEVHRILQAHSEKLKGVDAQLERALLGTDANDKAAWQTIPCPELKLPKRYQGALLFGQLVPRFDNRIISTCPVSGQKVPSRNCSEFLNFRWAMQLANIRVARPGEKELTPLKLSERKEMDALMRQQGSMGAGEFKKQVRQVTGAVRDNLDTMLMHPDAQDALLLDPVQKLIQSSELKTIWPLLPERLQKRTRGQLRHGKVITLRKLFETERGLSTRELAPNGSTGGLVTHAPEFSPALETELQRLLDIANTKGGKKAKATSREDLLNKPFAVKPLGQRAAYARHLLKQVYEDVMAGKPHPKEEGGCLFVTEQMREAQLHREIADQTNNHLVRHRLLILERLLGDIIKEYAGGEKSRVARITIEVNRDLREMSGKTNYEKQMDLNNRIKNHHHVATSLEEKLKDERLNGAPINISAGLIRKGRVAEDLGWKCPYTGHEFEPKQLVTRQVDKDHIIPRSDRASDSLDSLVITFSAINKWKGKRTAWQFVEQEQGKPVPDLPNLSILSLTRYKQFVEGLETKGSHDDDKRRKKKRKALLLLPSYEEKEFVPRDLTTTSQLVRLGAQALQRYFGARVTNPPAVAEAAGELRVDNPRSGPVIISLPGSVTGTVRKAWKVLGCLGLACPQVLDETGEVKKKDDIRDITHLHHALDACVIGLASHFIPNNGRCWELILKRNPNDAEKKELMALGVFGFNAENRFEMRDLDNRLKEQIRQRLAEKRVVQHIPARMDGMRVEQNTWRVVSVKDGEATLQQRIRGLDGKRPIKQTEEKTGKLLGLNPVNGSGKLQAVKGVLVIPDNFGIVLEPQPTIIPFHKVWTRLQELQAANGGKTPRVLRNGQIVQVPSGKYKGIWRVFSVKASMTLDLGTPDKVRLESKGEGQKREVQIKTLLKDGMHLTKTPLTGIPVCPTTSSASIPPTVP